jgi:hypothetical protein
MFSAPATPLSSASAYAEAPLGNAKTAFPLRKHFALRRSRRRPASNRRPADALRRQGHLPGDRDAGVRPSSSRCSRAGKASPAAAPASTTAAARVRLERRRRRLVLLRLPGRHGRCDARDPQPLRSPTGRAFVAIATRRSAREHGPPGAHKTLSFAISAALAGVGGALYAHKLKFISPDQFDILRWIDLV